MKDKRLSYVAVLSVSENDSVFRLFPWTPGRMGPMASSWVSVPDGPCPHRKPHTVPPLPGALSSVLCGQMPSGAAGRRAPCGGMGCPGMDVCSLQVFTTARQMQVPHETHRIVTSLPRVSQQEKSTRYLIFISRVV